LRIFLVDNNLSVLIWFDLLNASNLYSVYCQIGWLMFFVNKLVFQILNGHSVRCAVTENVLRPDRQLGIELTHQLYVLQQNILNTYESRMLPVCQLSASGDANVHDYLAVAPTPLYQIPDIDKLNDLRRLVGESGSDGFSTSTHVSRRSGVHHNNREFKRLGFKVCLNSSCKAAAWQSCICAQNVQSPLDDLKNVTGALLALDCMLFFAQKHHQIFNKVAWLVRLQRNSVCLSLAAAGQFVSSRPHGLPLRPDQRAAGAAAVHLLPDRPAAYLRLGDPRVVPRHTQNFLSASEEGQTVHGALFAAEQPLEQLFAVCLPLLGRTWREMKADARVDMEKVHAPGRSRERSVRTRPPPFRLCAWWTSSCAGASRRAPARWRSWTAPPATCPTARWSASGTASWRRASRARPLCRRLCECCFVEVAGALGVFLDLIGRNQTCFACFRELKSLLPPEISRLIRLNRIKILKRGAQFAKYGRGAKGTREKGERTASTGKSVSWRRELRQLLVLPTVQRGKGHRLLRLCGGRGAQQEGAAKRECDRAARLFDGGGERLRVVFSSRRGHRAGGAGRRVPAREGAEQDKQAEGARRAGLLHPAQGRARRRLLQLCRVRPASGACAPLFTAHRAASALRSSTLGRTAWTRCRAPRWPRLAPRATSNCSSTSSSRCACCRWRRPAWTWQRWLLSTAPHSRRHRH